MAITWDWDRKIGTATLKQRGDPFTVSLYKGNCDVIGLYEYEDGGNEMYAMHFFAFTKSHADALAKMWNEGKEETVLSVDITDPKGGAKAIALFRRVKGIDLTIHT